MVNIPYIACLGKSSRRSRVPLRHLGLKTTEDHFLREFNVDFVVFSQMENMLPNEDPAKNKCFFCNTLLSTKVLQYPPLRILKVESMQSLYHMVHMLLKKKC